MTTVHDLLSTHNDAISDPLATGFDGGATDAIAPAPLGPLAPAQMSSPVDGMVPSPFAAAAAAAASTATPAAAVTSQATGGLILNLEFDAKALAAPASFRSAIENAAAQLEAAIHDNITVNIQVGYGEIQGERLPDPDVSEGGGNLAFISYSQVRSLLADHETSNNDVTSVDSLPTGTSLQGKSTFDLATAQEKALGLLSPTASGVDGFVGFGTGFTGEELIAAALHEITHAMGRLDGTAFDLFRYNAPGHHVFSNGSIPAAEAYFSIDGGKTDLADFGQDSDPGDFKNPPDSDLTPNDPFNETVGNIDHLTAIDLEVMDALGFNVTGASGPPPTVAITSTGGAAKAGGQTVSGTVDAADAGTTVRLFDGTTQIGSGIAGATGKWSIHVSLSTTATHKLTAKAGATGDIGTSAPAFVGTPGADNFSFTAGTLHAGVLVVGGAGADTIALTSAATIAAGSLAGLSGIDTIRLANGTNRVTLGDAEVAASDADKLTVTGGSGADTINASAAAAGHLAALNGGSGNDTLIAGHDATLTGGSGNDIFEFATPGTASSPDTNRVADFAHALDRLAFRDAGFNLGIDEGDGTATPQHIAASLFSTRTDGTFATASNRFAYDSSTGRLFYDAQGNAAGSTRLLVATLGNTPVVTAADLYYVA